MRNAVHPPRLNHIRKLALPLLILVLGLARPSYATNLAEYYFASGTAASVDTDTATSASAFGFGPAGTNWAFSSSSSTALGRGDTTSASDTLAISEGSYFTFTLTPTALGSGNGINLTDLSFKTISNTDGQSVSTDPFNVTFFVRSSLDGFAANIGSSFTQAYSQTTALNPVVRTLDLSAYQGIVSTTEFRIYVFDDTTEQHRTPRVDNVVLTGAIAPLAVPEPATWALFGGFGALLFALVRRRVSR